MTSRRRMTIAAVAAAGFLLTGCSGPGVPVVASGDASTAGVVAAIRLSPQLYDIDRGARVGWVLLIDGRGRAIKLKTGPMDTGHLTWTRTGLSFSDQKHEYVLSDEGLSTVVRGSEEAYETSRFPTADGAGFIAVYNVGFGDRRYEARVTTGDATVNRSWDVAGMYEAVSQCGGSVFAMTDIKELGPGFATNVRTDALVQLYPQPTTDETGVRATLPIPRGGFGTASTDAPCENGTIFTLATQSDHPDATVNERPIIRAWNTATGTHTVIPLVTVDGAPLDVPSDDTSVRPARIVGDRYVWIGRDGRVFNTNLGTGVTDLAFKVAVTSPETGSSQFVLTDKSVYVLDVSENWREPLDLSRYDLATGKRTKLLSIPGTGSMHRSLDMIIRDLALDPDWVEAHERGFE